jgi:DNA-binding transcriptional LysR family regulator
MPSLCKPDAAVRTKKSGQRQPDTPMPVLRRFRPPRLYVYFDPIVRHGSMRRAAEALHIASSGLIRRVLDQQDAGPILFDRLKSGVRLTAAGEAFAAHVRRTLADLNRVGDHIQALQG